MPDDKKDPALILHEAIFICGDCPECGSDNWTDCEQYGECHSCGTRFNPTIPRQMKLASQALDAIRARIYELEGRCQEAETERRAYRGALRDISNETTEIAPSLYAYAILNP